MKRFIGLLTLLASSIVVPTHAQNLLTGSTFEVSEVPFWTLLETYTNDPNATPNTISVNDSFLDKMHTQPKSLWFRPFAGSMTNGPQALVNGTVTQTVAATPGQQYNFSGWTQFESSYSGGVTTLNSGSPLGAAPSPTTTRLVVEYLNASNAVIGSPSTFDIKQDRINQIGFPPIANDNNYYKHTLTSTAPAGATQIRVSLAAKDMLRNPNASSPMSMFVDSFSLNTTAAPTTELLQNALLDDAAPSALEGWTVTQNDPANPTQNEIIRANSEGFANHTPGGSTGVWLSAFIGEPGTAVDGSISKIVPGTAGESYSFSAWSKLEANYTAASTYIQLSFLNASQVPIGSATTLDVISAGQLKDGTWRQYEVNGVAPVGTAFVKVLAGLEDGVIGPANPQGGFFDDFVLEIDDAGIPGDFDNDGDVDGRDFLAWQRGASPNGTIGGPVSGPDLAEWQGAYNGGNLGALAAVPEPATLFSLAVGLIALGASRRRV